jgi:TonB-dependent receptor
LYDDTDGAEGNRFLMPGEFNPRREIGQRERWNFNLGLEFRPTDQDEFFFHGTIAEVHDEDLKIREVWELDDAGSGSNEVVEIGPNSFVLTDVDIATDLWWQDIHNDSYAFDFGGTHTRGDWTTEYKLGTSESRSDRTGSARAQWRERDNAVRGTWWRDGNTMEVIPFDEAQLLPGISSSDVGGDALDYSNFDWMRAWFDDSLGGDEIHTARFDITKDLFIGNASGYVKFGAIYTDRSVDKDNNRPQFDPTDGYYEDKVCGGDPDCEELFNLNMDDFGPLAIPRNSIKQVPTPSWDTASPIIERMRPLMPIALAGQELRDNFRRDYTADETVSAAYLMGSFDVTEKLRVIGGVRVEDTDFSSTGYLTIRNDDFPLPGADETSAIVHDLGKASKSYTDVFPSLTVRYEPNDEVVIRGSISTSTNRPDFSLVKNSALYSDSVELFNTELDQSWEEVTEDCQDLLDDGDPLSPTCTELTLSSWAFDGDEFDFDPPAELTDAQWAITQFDLSGTFEIGNPDLNPMMSTNFDFSVGWYPSRSTYLSVAVYRKDITDWIAPLRLRDVTFADLPVSLPDIPELALFQIDNDTVFESVEVALNGEEAEVTGIEFAFSHSFDNGIFIDGNAAFMDSWATLLSRTDKLPLIDQADMTANLSLGYQNEVLTMRVSGNHRGEYLVEIGAEPGQDAYGVPYTAVDFNARWDVNENMQLYFDAINLTDEQEAIEWQGDEISGPMYYE